MEVSVEGEELLPEMFSEDLGWQTAVARRSSRRAAGTVESKKEDVRPSASTSAGHRQNGEWNKKRVIKAGRMPPLPKDDAKIIIRPRGGLDVSKVGATNVGRAIMAAAGVTEAHAGADVICPNLQQNIIVVSTPDRDNAARYTRIKSIVVMGKEHEVRVIRGITLSDSPEELERNIINARNPLALAAKGSRTRAQLLWAFDGWKVPNFVRYGPVWGMQRTDPDEQHQCIPKCKLCDGAHMTAAKVCRHRYQIPYVVREEDGKGRQKPPKPRLDPTIWQR
ncbi:hypothetical protein HPB52_011386 [Rhipicephalus sanguineus]|uniref:Uncharacterized protein n=1 Tax=Rhipicephalus sanguineus TaxID=34632 RepID=A0A9D4PEA7_RHISA|nr:hypothetical protein HPB52_011386 [Rhipicephalus sanguineus]